jgi:hypothetical protein
MQVLGTNQQMVKSMWDYDEVCDGNGKGFLLTVDAKNTLTNSLSDNVVPMLSYMVCHKV